MIVTLEWLSRILRDLPRPRWHGEVIRVINPNQGPRYVIEENPFKFRELETSQFVSAYIYDDNTGDTKLRWVLPKDLRVAL